MRRSAIIFGIFILIIVILADTRHLGGLYALYDFPFGDKVGHFFLFGLLSMAINLSVISTELQPDPSTRPSNIRKVIQASLILALFVGLEEFSQRWFPSRTSDVFDLLASCLGITFFAVMALMINKMRSLQK